MNIAEKLHRVFRTVNYKTKFVLPVIDTPGSGRLDPIITKSKYSKLVDNRFFKMDPDIHLTSALAEEFYDHFDAMRKVG